VDTINDSLWSALHRESAKPKSDHYLDRTLNLYERLQQGHLHYQYGSVALSNVLELLEKQFSVLAGFSGVKLTVSKPSVWVGADPLLLFTSLAILVQNAIRHSHSQEVTVSVRLIRASVPVIKIVVSDSGRGISESLMQELEQPQAAFILGDTGLPKLGIRIVKAVCKLMRHQLSLRSTLGAGTTASISLPRIPSHYVERSRREPHPDLILALGREFGKMLETLTPWANKLNLRFGKASSFESIRKHSGSIKGRAALLVLAPDITEHTDYVSEIEKLRSELNQPELITVVVLPSLDKHQPARLNNGVGIFSLAAPLSIGDFQCGLELLLSQNLVI
jgi:two-component sensor histidine kinase